MFWDHFIAQQLLSDRPAVRPIETKEEEDRWQLHVNNDHEQALKLEPRVRSIPKPKQRLDDSEGCKT